MYVMHHIDFLLFLLCVVVVLFSEHADVTYSLLLLNLGGALSAGLLLALALLQERLGDQNVVVRRHGTV